VTFALAASLLCVVLLAAALVWRAEADRRERSHLVHLLVGRHPAEVALLDRAAASPVVGLGGPVERAERAGGEWEPVGERAVGA